MKNRKTINSGAILPFVGIVGVALGILVLHISRTVQLNSGQMVYFNNMNRVYRLTESAMAVALGQLAVNPTTGTLVNTMALDGPINNYRNYVERSTVPIYNGFYILTSATITVSDKTYASELHTYAGVANIGAYFAALKNEFVLSPGMDATGGRIYAPQLVFLTGTTPNVVTRAQTAEFVYAATARDPGGAAYTDFLNWENVPAGPPYFLRNGNAPPNEYYICLGDNQALSIDPCKDGSGNLVRPTRLDYPIQFPALSTLPGGDFTRYYTLATALGANHTHGGPGAWDMRQWDHIYPPGYMGAPFSNDYYNNNFSGRHTTNNADHVYYAANGIRIGKLTGGTTIHGQVLFVTPGDIEIWGNIFSEPSTSPSDFPGHGFVSSSTAHQAVFISGGKIVIITTQPAAGLLAPGSSRHVEAFFFAPNGGLRIEAPPSAALVPAGRNFTFIGSWVLGQTDPEPENLPTQFTGTRRYSYMQTLKDNPPPYLPALAEIYQSFEVPKLSANLY